MKARNNLVLIVFVMAVIFTISITCLVLVIIAPVTKANETAPAVVQASKPLTPNNSPQPTYTPLPTDTSFPMYTPLPPSTPTRATTSTRTLTPTRTPTPSRTPIPSATPVGLGVTRASVQSNFEKLGFKFQDERMSPAQKQLWVYGFTDTGDMQMDIFGSSENVVKVNLYTLEVGRKIAH